MSMLKCKAESASKHWTSRCGNVYIEGGIISPRNHGLGLGLGLAAHGLGLGLGLGTTGLDYKTGFHTAFSGVIVNIKMSVDSCQ